MELFWYRKEWVHGGGVAGGGGGGRSYTTRQSAWPPSSGSRPGREVRPLSWQAGFGPLHRVQLFLIVVAYSSMEAGRFLRSSVKDNVFICLKPTRRIRARVHHCGPGSPRLPTAPTSDPARPASNTPYFAHLSSVLTYAPRLHPFLYFSLSFSF